MFSFLAGESKVSIIYIYPFLLTSTWSIQVRMRGALSIWASPPASRKQSWRLGVYAGFITEISKMAEKPSAYYHDKYL